MDPLRLPGLLCLLWLVQRDKGLEVASRERHVPVSYLRDI